MTLKHLWLALGNSLISRTIRNFRETILRTFCVKIACETDASSLFLRASGEASNFSKTGFRMVENVGLVLKIKLLPNAKVGILNAN